MHSITKESIIVWTTPWWGEIQIKYTTIDSWNPWKHILLQSWLHGWEVTHRIQKDIFSFSQQHLTAWKITFVPLANPLVRDQRMYFSTSGKFDRHTWKDTNHLFPGDPHGNIFQKTCHHLINIAQSCDLVIDLHTSRHSRPFSMVITEDQLRCVDQSWLRFNYLCTPFQKCYTDYLCTLWVNAFTIECGSHDTYNTAHAQEVVQALLHIIASYKMYEQHVLPQEDTSKDLINFTQTSSVYSEHSGIVTFHYAPWEYVDAWSVLCTISSLQDLETVSQIHAPYTWYLLKQHPSHIIRDGDVICEIIATNHIIAKDHT